MPRADRLQRDLFFCLCTPTRKLRMGEEKRCRMSMLVGRSSISRKSGHGYPIIFIHEFASDIRGWENPSCAISPVSYRCIAYNARGYPPSDVPEDASLYRWQFAVDDIAAVMRGLKIERAHLVGLSMGGYAALQFGVRYPGKSQRDCRSRRGIWLSSFPARRLVEGDVAFSRGYLSSTEWSRWPRGWRAVRPASS